MKTLTTILIILLILLSACTQPTPTVETKTAESEVQQQTTETPTLGKSPDYDILMEYEKKIRQFNNGIDNIKNAIEWSDDDIGIQKDTLLLLSELDEIKRFIDTNREALIVGEYNPEYEKQKITDKTNQLMKTLLSKQSTTSTVQEKAELPIPSQKVVAPVTVSEADVLLEQCYDACRNAYSRYMHQDICFGQCLQFAGSAKNLRGIISIIEKVPPSYQE
jgi:hypothetical protein